MTQRGPGDPAGGAAVSRRIDQWLWFTRIVKSRTLAADLVTTGKVRVNRERIDKPSHGLKLGDVVTVAAHSRVRVLKVSALGVRRGPPSEAVGLYEDLTPPPPPRDDPTVPAQSASRDPGAGRPTKRDRRAIDKLQRDD